MKKTINLTKIDGCYSKELREFCPTIKFMLNESSISCDEMIHTVHAIVDVASINAEAKKRFIKNLYSCKSKVEVDKLCSDAVIHGMYYHPKKKESEKVA